MGDEFSQDDLAALVASGFGLRSVDDQDHLNSSEEENSDGGDVPEALDVGDVPKIPLKKPSGQRKATKKKKKQESRSTQKQNPVDELLDRKERCELASDLASSANEAAPAALVEELLEKANYLQREDENIFQIPVGHVGRMRVPGRFFANASLLDQLVDEVGTSKGGFTAAIEQISNVATLPGIVGASLGMPDLHSGYGFAIGNIAAMDMSDDCAVVSPGGVGFDINCGVRLVRSNLTQSDVFRVKDKLADALFEAVPVGVGSQSVWRLDGKEMDDMLKLGMEWTEKEGLSWPEDREVTEESGRFLKARPSKVSSRAISRGKSQLGTLGSGNHYVEVQIVDEVFDEIAAKTMGLTKGTICVMMHTGSRGFGHQVCTDALAVCEGAMRKYKIRVADRQLACAPVTSEEGKGYIAAMSCAANFAFCNRTLIVHQVREAFEKVYKKTARELDMHVVYDVSHNIAKMEEHNVNGETKKLLVHRKGATRAFGPGHPCLPEKYREIGQPVLIGGSMGSCSYVLTGTQKAMETTFGSTCHGAGRFMSRSKAMKCLDSKAVLRNLAKQNIAIRVATKRLVAEEAPESYKDVSEVVDTCEAVGISRKCVRLKPLIVVKG